MVRFVRPLSLLLAALIALAGGTFDLCGCEGAVHGSLCAEAELPAPVADACCCCEPETPPAPQTDLQLRSVGCECPVVQLATSPASDPASVVPGVTADLTKALHVDLPLAQQDVVTATDATSARSPPPEPGGIRRHLLLSVLRC